MPNDPETPMWRAGLWDTPSNGARHYVHRDEQYAEDGRGNVWTGTRERAERLASKLNALEIVTNVGR